MSGRRWAVWFALVAAMTLNVGCSSGGKATPQQTQERSATSTYLAAVRRYDWTDRATGQQATDAQLVAQGHDACGALADSSSLAAAVTNAQSQGVSAEKATALLRAAVPAFCPEQAGKL